MTGTVIRTTWYLLHVFVFQEMTSLIPSLSDMIRAIASIIYSSVVSRWMSVGWSQSDSITGHGNSDVRHQRSL